MTRTTVDRSLRIAEMEETEASCGAVRGGARGAGASTAWSGTRLVDKLAQVIGSANRSRALLHFTVLSHGVTGNPRPRHRSSGLVRLAPVIVGGNTAVVIASETHPLVAIELAECLATADVPPGVVNVLTGLRSELGPVLASHMDVSALDLTGADGDGAELERLGAENVKRVVRGRADSQSPYDIAGPRAQDRLAPDRR